MSCQFGSLPVSAIKYGSQNVTKVMQNGYILWQARNVKANGVVCIGTDGYVYALNPQETRLSLLSDSVSLSNAEVVYSEEAEKFFIIEKEYTSGYQSRTLLYVRTMNKGTNVISDRCAQPSVVGQVSNLLYAKAIGSKVYCFTTNQYSFMSGNNVSIYDSESDSWSYANVDFAINSVCYGNGRFFISGRKNDSSSSVGYRYYKGVLINGASSYAEQSLVYATKAVHRPDEFFLCAKQVQSSYREYTYAGKISDSMTSGSSDDITVLSSYPYLPGDYYEYGNGRIVSVGSSTVGRKVLDGSYSYSSLSGDSFTVSNRFNFLYETGRFLAFDNAGLIHSLADGSDQWSILDNDETVIVNSAASCI